MYTRCTTEKTAEQQRILEHALLELVQRRPYEKVTVSALCEAAGVSRKTFYRLFETKEDVLCALVDRALTGYMPLVPFARPDRAQMEQELRHFLFYWRTQKPVLDTLGRSGRMELLVQRYIALALHAPDGLRQWLGAETAPEPEEKMLFFFCGVAALLINWHNSGYAKPVDEMAALLFRLLTAPPVKLDAPLHRAPDGEEEAVQPGGAEKGM